jgi:hypothetical protein
MSLTHSFFLAIPCLNLDIRALNRLKLALIGVYYSG